MTTRRTHSLLELDEELGELVPEARLGAAQPSCRWRSTASPRGRWSATMADASPEHVGLLLLEGVVSREVVVSDTVSTELLGPGDVVRPWAMHGDNPMLQLEIRWNALTESRVAVLDRRFARAAHAVARGQLRPHRPAQRARPAPGRDAGHLAAQPRRPAHPRAVLAPRRPLGADDVRRRARAAHALAPHARPARRRAPPDGVDRRRPSSPSAASCAAATTGPGSSRASRSACPPGEAQRVVPIRRRLIGQEPVRRHPPRNGDAEDATPVTPERAVDRASAPSCAPPSRACAATPRSTSSSCATIATQSEEMVRDQPRGERAPRGPARALAGAGRQAAGDAP